MGHGRWPWAILVDVEDGENHVAHFRLRHGNTELELPPGEFVIGRSSQCHLTIDDALVSRRHARILLENGQLSIEDLGSRNGYRLNGQERRERTALRHLDRVRIGNQDLVVIDESAESVRPRASSFCRVCGGAVASTDVQCPVCGAVVAASGRQEHATVELQLPADFRRGGESGSRPPSAFALVGSIANKALAMGRVDEAERMIGQLLEDVGGRLAQSDSPDAALLKETIEFAIKLAEGGNGAKWINFILVLHTKLKRLPEVEVVDALHEVARKVRFSDGRSVARLIEVVSANPKLTPAERFVVKRLETFQRVVSA